MPPNCCKSIHESNQENEAAIPGVIGTAGFNRTFVQGSHEVITLVKIPPRQLGDANTTRTKYCSCDSVIIITNATLAVLVV